VAQTQRDVTRYDTVSVLCGGEKLLGCWGCVGQGGVRDSGMCGTAGCAEQRGVWDSGVCGTVRCAGQRGVRNSGVCGTAGCAGQRGVRDSGVCATAQILLIVYIINVLSQLKPELKTDDMWGLSFQLTENTVCLHYKDKSVNVVTYLGQQSVCMLRIIRNTFIGLQWI
jgi:hypothetical protein